MPMPLHVQGEELITTSDKFMELDTLPSPIVFIGGGFISFEFAHVAARAGAEAHILEAKSRPLAGFDPDLVDRLLEATRALGIQVHLECEVKSLERRGDEIAVHAEEGGKQTDIAAKLAVHGGGRVPNIDGLNLNAGGVERTEKGIKVNKYLQSVTNPAVYAAGDAADGGGLQLTPVAGVEGETAAENLLHGNRRTIDFSGLASIVYTDPPLAAAGLSQAQAQERGLRCIVKAGDTSDWYSSRRIAAKPSGYKVLIDGDAGVLAGAHVLGEHAEELINLFALAIRAKIPVATLRETLFAYPTASSDIEYMI
jgi:glutathione reductase (NADPH)